jgi:alkanesulfonate monooxygenase SsuD/methylene tetrahydromethanopterin reductase-like flavin-dependent oxidoreductase (luciferase family)
MTSNEWHPSGVFARGNKFKLGLFSLNLERGGTISTAPEVLPLEWRRVAHVAAQADEMGLELLVPVARWRGFGGETNYPLDSYDTFCWAAGLAAATRSIHVWSTCHVPTIHPIVAAKQLVTIDHLSGGRAGLNIVGGWFEEEMLMFGRPILEHDKRYELAEEWTKIVTHLWTRDEPLDFEGEFFKIVDGVSQPKPLQRPRPALMNAGGSERGQHFAAEYADMVFVFAGEGGTPALRNKVDRYKAMAQDGFQRRLEVWTQVNVICGDTPAEARELRDRIVAGADWTCVENMVALVAGQGKVEGVRDDPTPFVEGFIFGWGAPCLVGTADVIAAELQRLASCGLDGCLLCLPEWEHGLDLFRDRVLPLLEEVGLREPFSAAEMITDSAALR